MVALFQLRNELLSETGERVWLSSYKEQILTESRFINCHWRFLQLTKSRQVQPDWLYSWMSLSVKLCFIHCFGACDIIEAANNDIITWNVANATSSCIWVWNWEPNLVISEHLSSFADSTVWAFSFCKDWMANFAKGLSGSLCIRKCVVAFCFL